MSRHAVILGDPSFFRIKGGKNPYTRTPWGFRKKVDLEKAKSQWQNLKETLERLGAKIHVLPPQPDHPGMVFPANAGFLHPKYEALPWKEKCFYLSNLTVHRKNESGVWKNFITSLGIPTDSMPFTFEGEADFFPAGEFYLFTYGDIVPTGFRLRLGWPPYRYQFSHRSDVENLVTLKRIAHPETVIPIRLVDTRYYHGDTALFAFGPKREHLFVYFPAIDMESRALLEKHFGKNLLALSEMDAENFVANSFQLDTPQGPYLLIPAQASDAVRRAIRERGLAFTTVDVSEFFEKGGGSIKCLLCDLGPAEN